MNLQEMFIKEAEGEKCKRNHPNAGRSRKPLANKAREDINVYGKKYKRSANAMKTLKKTNGYGTPDDPKVTTPIKTEEK